jgi:hypothetical protein
VPLHTPTVRAPRLPRLGRVAALAVATCATAGAVTTVIADDPPAAQVRAIAAPSQPAAHYFDIEANKVASMRALGRHIRVHHSLPSAARVDAAAQAATMRAIGAALAKRARA